MLLGVASGCSGSHSTTTFVAQAVTNQGTYVDVLTGGGNTNGGGSGRVYAVEVDGQTVAVKVPLDTSEAGLQAAQNSIVAPEYLGPPPTSVSGYVTFTLPTGEQVTGVPMSLVDGVTLNSAETQLKFCQAFQLSMDTPLSAEAVAEFQATYQQMLANGLIMGDLNGGNVMVNAAGKVIIIDNPLTTVADVAARHGAEYAQTAVDLFSSQIDLAVQRLTAIAEFQTSMSGPSGSMTTAGEVTAGGDLISPPALSLSADGISVGVTTSMDGTTVVTGTNALALEARTITVTASASDIASGVFDMVGTVLDVTATALESAIAAAAPIVTEVQAWLAVLDVTFGLPLDAPTTVPLGNGNVTYPPQAPSAGGHGHYYVERMNDGGFVITDEQSGNAMGYLRVSDGSYTAFKADLDVGSGNYTFRCSDGYVATTDHRGNVLATYANPNNDHFTGLSINGSRAGGGGAGAPPGGTCNRPAGATCEDCAGPPETQDPQCNPNQEIRLGDLTALQAENCRLMPSVTTVANAANAQQIPTTITFVRSGIAAGTFSWGSNGRIPFHQSELDATPPVTDRSFDANYLGVPAGSYHVHTLLTLANGQMIPCGDSTITVVAPNGGAGGGGATCSIGNRVAAGNSNALNAALDDYYCAVSGGSYCTFATQYASAAGTSTVATGTCANGATYKSSAALDEYYCRYYEYMGFDTASAPDYGGYCAAANNQASLGACTGCGGAGGGGGGCVPTTCAAHGQTCGTLDDGCGRTLACGGSCTPSLAITSASNLSWDATTVTAQLVGTFAASGNTVNLSCSAGGYPSVFNVSVTYNSASLIDIVYPRVYGPGSAHVCQVRVNAGTSSSAYVTLNGFSDLADSDPTAAFAYEVFDRSIMPACVATPVSFCPSSGVPRSDAAAYIIRSAFGDSFAYTATPYFTDVPSWDPDFKYVQKMRDLGITSGCGPTTFCGSTFATRGDIAVFVIRAIQAKNGRAVDAFGYPATPYFTDVPVSDGRFKFVQAMRAAGITSGCTSTTFCVGDNVTRSQLATFVVRALVDSVTLPDP